MSKIVVAVDEGDAIMLGESFDPESMVVRPIQEANDEYQICLEALEYCLETGDFDSLDSILLFEDAHKRSLKKAAKLAGYNQEELKKAEDTQRDPEETKIRNLSPEAQRGVPAHLLGAPTAPKGKGSKRVKKVDVAPGVSRKGTGNMNVRGYQDTNKIAPTPMNDKEKDRQKGNERIANHLIQNPKKSIPQSGLDKEVREKVEHDRAAYEKMEEKKREEGNAKAALPKVSHRPAKPKGSENWAATKDTDNQSDWAAWADKKHEENNTPVKTDDVVDKAQSNTVPTVAAASSPDAKASGSSNMLKYGAAAAGGAALAGGAWYAYKKYKNQPKSVIGKRIAALRQIYAKFMKKAQSSHDSGVAANLKRIAAKVLSVIDKLMGYLQNKAG